MQNVRWNRLLWLAILMTILVGCAAPPVPPTATPAPTATSTFTSTPTQTPTLAPTNTPTPTFTPFPTQSISSIANELLPSAQGGAVPSAAEYDPGKPGIHKIILISSVDQTDWNKSLPESWRPQYVSETELVVVLQFNEVLLETKQVTIRGIGRVFLGRFRTDIETWLYEAKTGKRLAYIVFTGAEPPPFPGRFTSNTILTGPPVSSAEVQTWLRSFVEK